MGLMVGHYCISTFMSFTNKNAVSRQGFIKVQKVENDKLTSRKNIQCWVVLKFLRVEECWKRFCKTHETSNPSCANVLRVLHFTSHGDHLHGKATGPATLKNILHHHFQ